MEYLVKVFSDSIPSSNHVSATEGLLKKWNRLGSGAATFLSKDNTPGYMKNASLTQKKDPATLIVAKDGQRFHILQTQLNTGTIWFKIPVGFGPAIGPSGGGPAFLILVLMLLGAPLATWLVANSLTREFGHISRALGVLGHRSDVLYVMNTPSSQSAVGVPICSNDETGDQ